MRAERRRRLVLTGLVAAALLAPNAPAQAPSARRLPVAAASSEAPAIASPELGLIGDGSGALRRVSGMIGFAGAGPAIRLPEGAPSPFLAPARNYALAAMPGPEWRVLRLDGGAAALGPALPVPALEGVEAAFSENGQSAVLHALASGGLYVVTGLPEAPRLAFSADASSLGGPVVSLAVDGDGRTVLAGTSSGEDGAVWRIGEKGAERIASAGFPVAIRFTGPGDAVVADQGWNQITALHGSGSPVASEIIAGSADGIDSPRDLAFSAPAKLILVANAGAKNLILLPAGGGPARAIGCDFTPARLQPLAEAAVVVSSTEHGARWIFQATASGPRVAYLPRVD